MIPPKMDWALHHPVSAIGGLLRWLERHPCLPVGRSARGRRLLHDVLEECERALVIGPPHVVRQALPRAVLDVVGSNPNDVNITVVSEALGAASLPRRWDCVIVTERAASWDRLVAAAGACRRGGVLVVLGTPQKEPGPATRSGIKELAHSEDIRLIVAGKRA